MPAFLVTWTAVMQNLPFLLWHWL